MKHTKEPWKIDIRNTQEAICRDNHLGTIVTYFDDLSMVDAQRIVSCVNALADKDPNQLENLFSACHQIVNGSKEKDMNKLNAGIQNLAGALDLVEGI